MPSIKDNIIKLHLAVSIEELNSLAELPEKFKKTNIKSLISTADKLFTAGEENIENGDQERSYLYFMKYLNVISLVKKSPLYTNDPKFYNGLVGMKKVQKAIEKAEYLNEQLRERYKERLEEMEIKRRLEELDRKEMEEEKSREKTSEDQEKLQESKLVSEAAIIQQMNAISSWDVNTMIKQKSTSFVIFDVRSKDDFEKSHIAHINCVNIPEDIIKPGLSAAALYELLPRKTKKEWPRRLTADVIVLIDWFGKREPGSVVHTLETIFTKWDPNSKYNGSITLLEGGYDDWLSRFPTETTNPHAAKPVEECIFHSFITVDDINYPDIDESFELMNNKEASLQAPVIERNKKPKSVEETLNIASVEDQSSFDIVMKEIKEETNILAIENKLPPVDRQLKQSALNRYEGIENSQKEYLKEREDLVESSIRTIEQNLDREKEWEAICREKAADIDGEIKLELQRREEELLQQLKEMEKVRLEQDQQIAMLKVKVDEFYSKDLNRTREERDIEQNIRSREEEKAKLNQQVEQLRKLRKRKEEEAMKRADELKKTEDERKKEEATKKGIEGSIKKHADDLRRNEELEEKKKYENASLKVSKEQLKVNSTPTSFGTKLNRSHSTPDLAQALQNELKDSSKPSVERSLKPLITNRTNIVKKLDINSNRNFAPVYGNRGRALTGLKNLGNTCYMNSILQCINNTTVLTKFFIEGNYRGCLNKNNKSTRGEIAEEIAAVVKALWSGNYRSIACKDFKAVFGHYKSTFRGYEQQDSHEFLTILLDWLHEDLNEVKEKAPLKEQNNDNILDARAAQMAWDDYNNSNKSIIVTLFGGQQRSCLKCLSCGKESVTFEPFFNLSLPIPQSASRCDIMDCFRLYTKPEHVSGWSCPSCKRRQDAYKKIDIWRLPPILIVHLQRFYNDGIWRKRLTMVDFNINDLDLKNITVGNKERYVRFKLYAVSNHYGTMDGGHYTAYCKNRIYDRWFKFDDQDVIDLTPNEVRSAAAYILFYAAIEYDVPSVAEE